VAFGPSDTLAYELCRTVQELGDAAWRQRKSDCHPLHDRSIREMRRHPFRLAMADVTRHTFT